MSSNVHHTWSAKLTPVSAVSSFFELSAMLINGKMDAFSEHEGRVVLVVNIASADTSCPRELKKLNDLTSTYGKNGLTVFGFPCNQFGHREPFDNSEIPLVLEHVRPGGRFIPAFKLFAKCDVNGSKANPVFEYLKLKQPFPMDEELPLSKSSSMVNWSPVLRSDIGWNFEKFLIDHNGQPVKRYSHWCPVEHVIKDVEYLLRKIPRLVREKTGITHLLNVTF